MTEGDREQLEADLAKLAARYKLPFAVLVTRTSELKDLPNGMMHMRIMTCSTHPDVVLLGDRLMTQAIPELIANNATAVMYRVNELAEKHMEGRAEE